MSATTDAEWSAETVKKAMVATAKVENALQMLAKGFRRAQSLRRANRKREAAVLMDELIDTLDELATPGPGLSMREAVAFYFNENGSE